MRAVEPVRVGTNTAPHGTVSSAFSTTVAMASEARSADAFGRTLQPVDRRD
jgi:hypothetical protein